VLALLVLIGAGFLIHARTNPSCFSRFFRLDGFTVFFENPFADGSRVNDSDFSGLQSDFRKKRRRILFPSSFYDLRLVLMAASTNLLMIFMSLELCRSCPICWSVS